MSETNNNEGVLEQVIDDIIKHDILFPTHGVDCHHHDEGAAKIRRLIEEKGLNEEPKLKCRSSLMTIFNYITR